MVQQMLMGTTVEDAFSSGSIRFLSRQKSGCFSQYLTLAADQSMASSDDEWPEKNATSAFVGGDQGSMNDI